MIRSKFAFAAEQILLDQRTGTNSAINILESLTAAAFPFFLPRLAFFIALERDRTDAELSNLIFKIGCNGTEVGRQLVTINFAENLISNFSWQVDGLMVPIPGKVEFEVSLSDGPELDSYSFAVDALPRPMEPPVQQRLPVAGPAPAESTAI